MKAGLIFAFGGLAALSYQARLVVLLSRDRVKEGWASLASPHGSRGGVPPSSASLLLGFSLLALLSLGTTKNQ
jgi:hypothetical protein